MLHRRPPFCAQRLLRAGLALSLVSIAACRDITALKQQNPGQLSTGSLFTPANAQLIVNGAIGDFECAYNRYVVGSGLLGDELVATISRIDNYDYDRRTMASNHPYGTGTCSNSSQIPGVYTTLSVARAAADTATAKLEGWTDEQVPNRTKLIGQAAAYAGYSLVLLGEGMCSAAINVGPELTPQQLFTEARTRFDKAIGSATAANDVTTLNLARLGRARALLNLGDLTAAGADAALIPDGFVVNFTPSSTTDSRRQNQVFVHTRQSLYSSVDPSFRNVTFDGTPDPRVAVANTGQVGTAGAHAQIWEATKYATITSPVPVAKWAEARLILAESMLANDVQGAVDIINDLHARAGIPAYDGTNATAAEVKAQIIEERRRALFLEGHRLGDIRRYDLPLDPAAGTPYVNGGTYGDQRCFPLPDVERLNNPNIGSKD